MSHQGRYETVSADQPTEYVVTAVPCPQYGCDPEDHYFDAYCEGCIGNGLRLDVDNRIPVERHTAIDGIAGVPCSVFVPLDPQEKP